MITGITGVILAGGKSTRMGHDKAQLPYHGKTLIENVAGVLSSIFARVLLSVNHENAYPQLALPEIADRYSAIGPMGGITTILESGEKTIFCAGCDMPFLNRQLIECLCSFEDFDAVIPVRNGKAEVLHALYSQRLLPAFQTSISNGQYRITDALQQARIKYVQDAEWQVHDPTGRSFQNINTPEEYERIP